MRVPALICIHTHTHTNIQKHTHTLIQMKFKAEYFPAEERFYFFGNDVSRLHACLRKASYFESCVSLSDFKYTAQCTQYIRVSWRQNRNQLYLVIWKEHFIFFFPKVICIQFWKFGFASMRKLPVRLGSDKFKLEEDCLQKIQLPVINPIMLTFSVI